MCIRDSFGTIQEIDDEMERLEDVLFEDRPAGPVSYTHLDVYKRQVDGLVGDERLQDRHQ